MKIFLIIPAFLLIGCANVSTSRMVYESSDGSRITLEIPKEIEAKDLEVQFDAQQGSAKITASSWVSRNEDTIKAQSMREGQILESSSVLVEKISEGVSKGVIEGAKKGLIP